MKQPTRAVLIKEIAWLQSELLFYTRQQTTADNKAKEAAQIQKLRERELELKEHIARSCGQMIEAVARLLAPNTF